MTASPLQQLRSHLDRHDTHPATSPGSQLCTTVEGTGANGRTFWLQLHSGQINFQHLDSPQHDELLGQILDEADPPDDVQLEPASHVCFDVTQMNQLTFHTMLERLLSDYFLAEPSSPIRIETQPLT